VRSLILLTFWCCFLQGATAVVECIADAGFAKGSGKEKQLPLTGVVMRFRVEAIRGWKVSRAQLHLHTSAGSVPANVEIAVANVLWQEEDVTQIPEKKLQFLKKKTESLPEGWWKLDIEPSLIEMLASGRATVLVIRDRTSAGASRSIDSREKNFSAGYLLVDGSPVP